MTIASVDTTLTGLDDYTTNVDAGIQDETGTDGVEFTGDFNVTISAAFVGTITLRRSFDAGVTWHPHTSWTAPVTTEISNTESGILHNIGITIYTSGSPVVRLSN